MMTSYGAHLASNCIAKEILASAFLSVTTDQSLWSSGCFPVWQPLSHEIKETPLLHIEKSPKCLTFLVRPPRQALFCCCFLFIFNNSFQSNYVNIYRIEFRQVCTVGRTMAVDAQSELVFRSLKGSPCQLVSDGFIQRIEFGWHLADGVSVR